MKHECFQCIYRAIGTQKKKNLEFTPLRCILKIFIQYHWHYKVDFLLEVHICFSHRKAVQSYGAQGEEIHFLKSYNNSL